MQAAILERLANQQKATGLDLQNMDVTTTNVTFDNNQAHATVAFHLKGDPNLTSGMTMQYTLQAENGKWVVTKVGNSSGHSMMNPMGGGTGTTLPPGHPSINQGASPANPHAAAPTQ